MAGRREKPAWTRVYWTPSGLSPCCRSNSTDVRSVCARALGCRAPQGGSEHARPRYMSSPCAFWAGGRTARKLVCRDGGGKLAASFRSDLHEASPAAHRGRMRAEMDRTRRRLLSGSRHARSRGRIVAFSAIGGGWTLRATCPRPVPPARDSVLVRCAQVL